VTAFKNQIEDYKGQDAEHIDQDYLQYL